MLIIRKTINEETSTAVFDITGAINSESSPKFEQEVNDIPETIKNVIFDFGRLDFISSSGLRVLIKLKKGKPDTSITATNVSDTVQEVFKLTGFNDFVTISDDVYSTVADTRVIFFDVDGTLYSIKQRCVPQSTKDALWKLHEKGIKLIICTGRSKQELSELPVGDLPIDGFLTLNGSLCVDENREKFAGFPIPKEEVDVLVRIFQANHIPFILNGEDNSYINHVDRDAAATSETVAFKLPDIGEYKGEDIYKCIAFVNEDQQNILENMLDECRILSWNKAAGMDIISKEAGKATGIDAFLDKYHLSRGQTMAFGDGNNDIDMIRFAGIGVSLGNGIDELKQAADYVTTDIDDDGIANALKHFGLL